MKCLRFFALLFVATIIQVVSATDFDPQSLQLADNKNSIEVLSPANSLAAFRTGFKSYRKILQWNKDFLKNLETVESETPKTEKEKYYLKGFTTLLGVSVSGTLGILNFAGQARTALFWERFPEEVDDLNKVENKPELPRLGQLELYATESEQRESFAELVKETLAQEDLAQENRIGDEALWQEFKRIKKVALELDRYELVDWTITDLAFEIGFGVKLEPGVALLTVGGDFRLRFQWTKSQDYLALGKKIKRNLFDAHKQKDLAREMRKINSTGYSLTEMRLGIILTSKGDLGLAELSGLASVFIWVAPRREMIEQQYPALISGKHWNRALKKVLRKSGGITKRSGKREKSKEHAKWGIKRIKVRASVGAGANVGVLSVLGLPNVEMIYDHEAWKKTQVQFPAENESGWDFSQIRLRTRLRAGVAVPWLASLSLRPMLEFFYR